jgi:hypothetical protein
MTELIFACFMVSTVLFALAVTATLGYLTGSIRNLEETQLVDLETGIINTYTAQQQMDLPLFSTRVNAEFPLGNNRKSGSIDTVFDHSIFP